MVRGRENKRSWDQQRKGQQDRKLVCHCAVWRSRRPVKEGTDGVKLAEVFDKVSKSFFFSDFPNDWTKLSMWRFFKQFGLVIDVFVPHKRSSLGKAFGFVRYKEVKDVNKLLRDIRSVAVGSVYITINEAKYKRTIPGTGKASINRTYHPPVTAAWKAPFQISHPLQENGNAFGSDILDGLSLKRHM